MGKNMKNKCNTVVTNSQLKNRTIKRYTIHYGETDLILPTFATVVRVEGIDSDVYLYILLDTSSSIKTTRKFIVVNTDQEIPEGYINYKYLGTTRTHITKHVFEVKVEEQQENIEINTKFPIKPYLHKGYDGNKVCLSEEEYEELVSSWHKLQSGLRVCAKQIDDCGGWEVDEALIFSLGNSTLILDKDNL